jgi:hypothetical protein
MMIRLRRFLKLVEFLQHVSCQARRRYHSAHICPNCSVESSEGRLVGPWTDREPWHLFLENRIQNRYYVHLAIWNKYTMAALNMRRIVRELGR